MSTQKPFCRKCLFEGISAEAVWSKIEQYLESLPADERTPEAPYAARLAVCEECPRLSNGLCTECGCFVTFRAGQLHAHCPLGEEKW